VGSERTITDIFWGAAEPATVGDSPREVARHALMCLEAFESGSVINSRTGKALSLMELLAKMGMEEDLVYASPELARGESFDERSLVFTVGVLIFERLTGRHPFGTSDNPAKVARIRRGEMGSGVNYFPQVPSGLRAILMRAMGPFPEERYSSMLEMKQALLKFGGVAGMASDGKAKFFFNEPTKVAPPALMEQMQSDAWSSDQTPASLAPESAEWLRPKGTSNPEIQVGSPPPAQPSLAEPAPPPPAVPDDAEQTEEYDYDEGAELDHLFDDLTDQAPPPPAAELPTSDKPLAIREQPRSQVQVAVPEVAGSARRGPSGPAPQQRSLARFMPLIYIAVGAAVSSIIFLIFMPRQPSQPSPAAHEQVPKLPPAKARPLEPVTVKVKHRPPEQAKPGPEEPKKVAASEPPSERDTPEPEEPEPEEPEPKKEPARRPVPPAVVEPEPGTPPGPAAGIMVAGALRPCLPKGEGRLRVAVYAQVSGKVIRSFVSPRPGLTKNVIKCIKKKLPGLELPVTLKKPDFVEWSLKIEGNTVSARVVRPLYLR
jgi:hypothetical protein